MLGWNDIAENGGRLVQRSVAVWDGCRNEAIVASASPKVGEIFPGRGVVDVDGMLSTVSSGTVGVVSTFEVLSESTGGVTIVISADTAGKVFKCAPSMNSTAVVFP